MNPAVPIVTAATLLGAAVAAGTLFRRRPDGSRAIDAPRLGRAALAVALLGGLELAVAALGLRRFFLAVNLVYTQVFVLVPLAGIAVLLAPRISRGQVRVTRAARALAVAGLALAPIGFVATFVEPYRLVTETADLVVPRERALPRPLIVGVLSDIQCVEVTERERDAVARVMAARPDLVLLPGDLQQVGFDHRDEIAPRLRELLAPLDAPLGVFYVEGDTEDCAQARYLLAGTRVRVLEDEVVRVERDGVRLVLGGVTLNAKTARASAVLAALEQPGDDDELRLLVSHRPDVALALPARTRVDWVVAGHTHGGQVQLPFVGPPLVLSRVPRAVGAGGAHDLDGRRVYVSRGIGWEHGLAPRVRFLCPPEVSLLTLRHAPVTDGPGSTPHPAR